MCQEGARGANGASTATTAAGLGCESYGLAVSPASEDLARGLSGSGTVRKQRPTPDAMIIAKNSPKCRFKVTIDNVQVITGSFS
jgi:hypothetical protein